MAPARRRALSCRAAAAAWCVGLAAAQQPAAELIWDPTSAPPAALAGARGGAAWHPSFRGLNASDVGALLCMGDSWQTGLNVGFREFRSVQPSVDYRGASWGCGDGVLEPGVRVETLGTLLRRLSPRLRGLSSGKHPFSEHHPCEHLRSVCGLNAASDGATVLNSTNDLSLLRQAHELGGWVRAEYPQLLQRWKVLTVLPALGDQWWEPRDSGRVKAGLRAVLLALRAQLPYTYVNLMGVMEAASSLETMMQRNLWCRMGVTVWKTTHFLKEKTVFNPIDASADAYARALNGAMRELAAEFDDGASFVVRFRPLLLGFSFDWRLTDALSCFHPNARLVPELAYGLVQNMLAPAPGAQLLSLPAYSPAPAALVSAKKRFDAFKRRVRNAKDLVFR